MYRLLSSTDKHGEVEIQFTTKGLRILLNNSKIYDHNPLDLQAFWDILVDILSKTKSKNPGVARRRKEAKTVLSTR